MEKQKYLNEEKYQRTKKKLKRIALAILLIGIIGGVLLIGLGVLKNNSIDKNTLNSLKVQKNEEFFANGLSLKYYELSDQLEKYENQSELPYVFYGLGGLIIFLSCFASFIMFFITHQREITAFTVQQGMPIAQEGMEKMAPSMGNAAKEIAKGIKEGLDNEEK